jgi:hypothetical protein
MKKSEVVVQSDHILQFVYDKGALFVRGIVQASMRDRSYKVTVSCLYVYIYYVSHILIIKQISICRLTGMCLYFDCEIFAIDQGYR